jgi:hypothetical protein
MDKKNNELHVPETLAPQQEPVKVDLKPVDLKTGLTAGNAKRYLP